MAIPDFTTVLVIGALVGLFFVALGYAQMVWLARRSQARGADRRSASPFVSWTFWAFAVLSGACILHAASARTLPDRQGFLVGEDLFAVRPRPGLVARYETNTASVRRDETLLRFTGQDGEEGQLAVKGRRQLLQGELELERARPLEFDQEIVRRVEAAKSTVRDREGRLKQLVSERDAITREMTQQRLALANRRFRIEQDDRSAQRELKPLRASVRTEQGALTSQQVLLDKGLLSKVEAARERDSLSEMESRVGQLQDQRALLGKERQEVENLRALSEKTFAQQLGERAAEIERVSAEMEAAHKALDLASAALEGDKPRAAAQREKRLRQIELQIEESDLLLSGRGRELTVTAPFDGRVGFREPSPSSVPADNGPLLVLYRPGSIAVTVRLEPGEPNATASDVRAAVRLPSSGGAADARPEATLSGDIVKRTLLPRGGGELRIACDPPDRIVRQLAMGGTIPVTARLSRSVFSAPSLWVGLTFGAFAVGAAVMGSLRQRRAPSVEPPAPDPDARASDSDPPFPRGPGAPQPTRALPGRPPLLDWAETNALARVVAGCRTLRRRIARGLAPELPWSTLQLAADHLDVAPQGGAGDVLALREGGWQRHSGALARATPPSPSHLERASPGDELAYLGELGAALRLQIEAGALAPGLVRHVKGALALQGYRAAALVGAGLGAIDKGAIERAAFALLTAGGSSTESLGDATRECAEFLGVMRVVAPERMNGAIDRLRLALIAAALDVAERGGSPSEVAATVVKPLVEA